MNYDLSIVIPARHEEWLGKTIESVLANTSERCQIIAVLDGEWPMTPIPDHPRLRLIHHSVSIGQRASINLGVRASTAKFVCKMDAHVTVGPNFDSILTKDCERNWIVTPRLFNLYVYDWRCLGCDVRTYQGPKPNVCGTCHGTEFDKVVVWLPRNGEYWRCFACKKFIHDNTKKPETCTECGESKGFLNIERRVHDSYRFDHDLHFQYHRDFPFQEGIAAFIHAKGSVWIDRLLNADLVTPGERLIARTQEYVVNYNELPLSEKYRLRAKAIKVLAHIRSLPRKRRQVARLLNLIELGQGHLIESMSMLGACWLLHRDFYWAIGGCDEKFGSWGAQGTEMSCKAHLSNGKLMVNRSTFFSHMFRTQHGDSFPYGITGTAQEAAKQYSRNLWFKNAWSGQVHPLSWLVEKFAPVPDWTDEVLAQQKVREVGWKPQC